MEAERGRATSLGGTQRLRGYRTNRFYDSYTNFRGVELRWYVLETQDAFNFIVEKGTFAGFQAAVFYEEGTVSPDMGANFWKISGIPTDWEHAFSSTLLSSASTRDSVKKVQKRRFILGMDFSWDNIDC